MVKWCAVGLWLAGVIVIVIVVVVVVVVVSVVIVVIVVIVIVVVVDVVLADVDDDCRPQSARVNEDQGPGLLLWRKNKRS